MAVRLSNKQSRRSPMKYRKYLVVPSLTLALFCVGCGASSETIDDTTLPSESESQLSGKPWHDAVNNASYTGEIQLMFKEDAAVRIDGAGVKSLKGFNTSPLEDVFKKYAAGSELRRGITGRSEEEIDSMRERAVSRGQKMRDWNSFYRIRVEDPEKAEQLLNILQETEGIEWAEPVMKTYSTSIFSPFLPTDPLVPQQSYTEGVNSLNIRAAWNEGLTGNRVTVTDMEFNWNFDHEDLPIDLEDKIWSSADDPYYLAQPFTNHGTAAVGVVSALPDNNLGTSGIAPGVNMKVMAVDGFYAGQLVELLSSLDNDNPPMKKGDILFIEMQVGGPASGPSGCDQVTQVGCLPIEATIGAKTAIDDLISAGIIVIEAAANGSLNLNTALASVDGITTPPLYIQNPTKAILVGASNGSNRTKTWYTNCHESRLDVFAWGESIVTAGYGDNPASTPGDTNKSYTSIFGGTSSATAITAGVAALLQEHVKNLYGDSAPYKNVYLNIDQMRDVLKQSGVDAILDATPDDPNPDCAIGKQPDLAAALQLLDNHTIKPTIELTPQFNLRYDIDDDKRSDLIEYSTDGKWYIDLSSVGSTLDKFGSWDRIITAPSVGSGKIFPVVADYNNDGIADLAVYNSSTGNWYIRYTDDDLLGGVFGSWDKIISYATHPRWEPNSRPIPGFYDEDAWIDIAITTPSGYWMIDLGGHQYNAELSYSDNFGAFEEEVRFLTDAQLAAAPGWAYLTAIDFEDNDFSATLTYKSPDDSPNDTIEENTVYWRYRHQNYQNVYQASDERYGGLETQMMYYAKASASSGDTAIGLKNNILGRWNYSIASDPSVVSSNVYMGYGDINCKPVPGDYDGDNKEDRAVMCGNHWRIAYSGTAYPVNADGFRDVYLPAGPTRPLPPVVYGGGISYQEIINIFDYYNFGCPAGEACTIDDMEPPVGPFFAECVKMWAPPPTYCLGK